MMLIDMPDNDRQALVSYLLKRPGEETFGFVILLAPELAMPWVQRAQAMRVRAAELEAEVEKARPKAVKAAA